MLVERTLVLLYFAACIGIGIAASKRVRGSGDEYWVAGRRVGTWVNAMAIMATLASGGAIIGVMGLAYSQGIPPTLAPFAGAGVGFPPPAPPRARRISGCSHAGGGVGNRALVFVGGRDTDRAHAPGDRGSSRARPGRAPSGRELPRLLRDLGDGHSRDPAHRHAGLYRPGRPRGEALAAPRA